jgi:glycosyltransferase involved in cell wall biosynthesis
LEQVESILEQQSVQTQLLIRDDGSTDGTQQILASLVLKHANISVTYGINIGVVKSFMALLTSVPPHAAFIAFADQDDIWRPDKLIQAVNQLNQLSGPVLYCSIYNAVDENAQLLWVSKPPPRAITFSNAIVQNITTGCTIVLNKDLSQLMKASQVDTTKIIMHDWWAYLVATCFGKVIFDSTPTLFYRQHQGNVIGVKNGFTFWLGRLKRFLFHRRKSSRIAQASEFIRLYQQDMDIEDTNMLKDFIATRQNGVFNRLSYTLRTPLYMQQKLDTLIVKLQLIIGTVN